MSLIEIRKISVDNCFAGYHTCNKSHPDYLLISYFESYH